MNEPEPESPYEEALRLLSEGEARKASDLLDWAGRSLDPLAHDEARAEVELSLRRYGAALEGAERTLRAGRETARLHMIAAEAGLALGLRAEGIAHAEAAGDVSARAAYFRARVAHGEGRFAEAERLAERASELLPGWDGPPQMALAARMAAGERSARIELLADWRRTRSGVALEFLIEDAGRRDEREIGDEIVRELRAEGIGSSGVLAWVLWYLVKHRDWEAAARTFDEAAENVRDAAGPLRMRASVATGQGRDAEAMPYLERAFALEPMNENGLGDLLRVLFRLRRWRRLFEVFGENRRVVEGSYPGGYPMREFFANLRWRRERAAGASRKRR